jgi:hypothetical protein
MPLEPVTADIPRAIRRPPGTTVTFVNQSATDVYMDADWGRLAQGLQGSVPTGTKIVNGGGQVQWSSYPGVIYVRAASATTLEVQP